MPIYLAHRFDSTLVQHFIKVQQLRPITWGQIPSTFSLTCVYESVKTMSSFLFWIRLHAHLINVHILLTFLFSR